MLSTHKILNICIVFLDYNIISPANNFNNNENGNNNNDSTSVFACIDAAIIIRPLGWVCRRTMIIIIINSEAGLTGYN